MNVTSASAVPDRLTQAFQTASRVSGTPFEYLLRTATRESALDPAARAPTSSATGLFQFIESTWLEMIKEEGPKYGLANAAAQIEQTSSGRYRVADPTARQAILALRSDPGISALMAGAFTARNSDTLAARLGRAPTDGELYAAHFLGAEGAGDLIEAASNTPGASAAALFPAQAAATRTVFYDRATGVARTAGELYARLTASGGRTPPAATGPTPTALAFAPETRSPIWLEALQGTAIAPRPETASAPRPGRFAPVTAAENSMSRFAPVAAAAAPLPSRFASMTSFVAASART